MLFTVHCKRGEIVELGERKKEILGIVVNNFINNGEPVGSKSVAESLSKELSSATIRNEMMALEEMGYLYQPHTSAGRIPSVIGYREYVERIMQFHKLTNKEKRSIDSFLSNINSDFSSLAKLFANKASEISGCAAVTVTPVSGGVVKMFEAVVAGKRLMVIIAISANGSVRTKLCVTQNDASSDSASILSRILNTVLSGIDPHDIGEVKTEILQDQVSKFCPDLKSVLSTVASLIEELKGYEAFVGGEALILTYPGFSDAEKAKVFINFLNKQDELAKVARENPNGGICVDVFSEKTNKEIRDISLISSGFNMGNIKGYMCVYGPTRIDYAKVLAKINYFTKSVSKLLSNTYFDDK